MSSGCGDVLSLDDLKTAKLHQTFEAEVITGLSGGVAGGASIDYATNQVTGQTQKTLPAVLRDAGFRPASFTFTTGGTLTTTDADLAVLWPIADGGDGAYYAWKGSLPKVVPASSTPDTAGGVSSSAWVQLGDITLRDELISDDELKGDALITVKSPLTGSVARTQHSKNAETVSVTDFMDLSSRVAGTTDDSAAFVAAMAASRHVRVPAGEYLASFAMPSDVHLQGDGISKTVIRSANTATTKQVTLTSVAGVIISDLSLDGQATAQISTYEGLLHALTCTDIHIRNVETINSGNAGIVAVNCDNITAGVKSTLTGCRVKNNYWEGIIMLGSNSGWDITGNLVRSNVHHGVVFKPYTYPFTAGECRSINFSNNIVDSNTGHGVFNAGQWSPTMTGDGDITVSYMRYTSLNNQFMRNSLLNNNIVRNNTATGMILGGAYNTVNNNVCHGNGLAASSGGFAGIVLCGYGMTCNGNDTQNNRTYGIDAGGAQSSVIKGNSITYNSVDESFCIGLNVGASANCIAEGNTVAYNGTNVATCYQVVVSGIDGDGVAAFPVIGTVSTVIGNTIIGQALNIGIRVHNSAAFIRVLNNMFSGFTQNNFIQVRCSQNGIGPTLVQGNQLDSIMSNGPTVASAATLVIPDGSDFIYVTGTTSITSIQSYSQNSVGSGVTGLVMTNQGTGYDPNSKPTITLPGGSGAVVNAEVGRDGKVIGMTVSTNGSGYTSGATVTISAPASGTTATGYLIAGALNNAGRTITLFFESACTVNVSGMNSAFSASSGSTLVLRGAGNGTWMKISQAA